MSISSLFEPVSEFLWQKSYSESSFFKQIHWNGEEFPDLKGIQIALIGLKESRGTDLAKSTERGSAEIRDKLYNLKRGIGSYRIADLGDLISGSDLSDTYTRMQEVGDFLMKRQILPIYFGGTHDLDFGQYLSYEKMKKMVSLLTVDSKFDMEDEGMMVGKHSQEIILHQPNFLFTYAHVAYQSYLVDSSLLGIMEKLYFDHLRLGLLRKEFKEIEPIVRNADLLSFDLSAIQSSDAPGGMESTPFGLTAEEAAQICWFAGTNEKLSSFGLYGYDPYFDDSQNKTAMIAAVMIWYFIEGFYSRKDSLSFKSSDYIKYTVSLDKQPSNLVFYKSKRSGKWWMEVPSAGFEWLDRGVTVVPCSYSDYQTAQKGEIPERWINSQIKLL